MRPTRRHRLTVMRQTNINTKAPHSFRDVETKGVQKFPLHRGSSELNIN